MCHLNWQSHVKSGRVLFFTCKEDVSMLHCLYSFSPISGRVALAFVRMQETAALAMQPTCAGSWMQMARQQCLHRNEKVVQCGRKLCGFRTENLGHLCAQSVRMREGAYDHKAISSILYEACLLVLAKGQQLLLDCIWQSTWEKRNPICVCVRVCVCW